VGLFHQYWLAKYGDEPNGGTFEYIKQLSVGPEWRMRGAGIGADTESRRNISNELGKAFARWFMYTHLGHTYFCPFETAMARSRLIPHSIGGVRKSLAICKTTCAASTSAMSICSKPKAAKPQ
jgi:hypothetical protein